MKIPSLVLFGVEFHFLARRPFLHELHFQLVQDVFLAEQQHVVGKLGLNVAEPGERAQALSPFQSQVLAFRLELELCQRLRVLDQQIIHFLRMYREREKQFGELDAVSGEKRLILLGELAYLFVVPNEALVELQEGEHPLFVGLLVQEPVQPLHQHLRHRLHEGVFLRQLVEDDVYEVVEKNVVFVGILHKVPGDLEHQKGRIHSREDVENAIKLDLTVDYGLRVRTRLDQAVLETVNDLYVARVGEQVFDEHFVEVEQVRLS